ncbi:hypothetical protein CC1G_10426 [Coprinopsis cinerea okayama7|uniref:Uncharacterized protein n=1 Tax=Coprinopsis cinerea (strain Okayama-7 / 130 / ATCC MYA-4618 / FGSC 9003) TaxID=240176 RepID=A8PDQ1_COPC7|nr:hypothetical protein CC1G_10426 [Coprinopsis cinerea okayama7\|eukprot:XP_001840640.2 hypothetical protein CC1G_10426 [Coprinopsis cinerea okayama7\
MGGLRVQKEKKWTPAEQRLSLPPHPIERFAHLVQQNPSLADVGRELEIENMRQYNVDDGYTVLDHLDQVYTLTFGFTDDTRDTVPQVSWDTISSGLQSSFLSFMRRNFITTLSLFGLHNLTREFFRACSLLGKPAVLNVGASKYISPGAIKASVKLRKLDLDANSIGFAEDFILQTTANIIDISEVSTLKIDFGEHGHDHVFTCILTLPKKLEFLELHLIKDFSQWTCRNNVLSQLPPSSLNTLQDIRLTMVVEDTPEFPPDLNLDPIKWKELDDILSSGFPSLRMLGICLNVAIFDSDRPFEEAAEKQAQLDQIFEECFDWSKENLNLKTIAKCRVI